MGGTWFINNDKFMSMPEDLRRIVVEGFDIIEQYLRAYPKYHDVESFNAFREAGGTVHTLTNEEKAAFREATSGMRDWFLAKGGDNAEWLARFESVVAQCEAAVDAQLDAAIQ
jgi:TRAP-type C4-dicarboxylate transport system substrate-binding protein